jgi:hypothetical protein
MANEESKPAPIDEKAPLAKWQRWLEFAQVIAVLCIGAGVAAPFAFGTTNWQGWVGLLALPPIGAFIAYMAIDLIRVDEESKDQYEITPARLATLGAIGTPADVCNQLSAMCDGTRWSGSASGFRDALYGRLGEKRGAVYVSRVLPYLEIYSSAPPPEDAPSVNTRESDVPLTEAKLSSRSLNL